MIGKFYKYQALGNDMIVIDPATFGTILKPESIKHLCQRHFGIGADGICFGPLVDNDTPPHTMRFFNPDGSEAEKSGNGLRVFARYLWDLGYVSRASFQIRMNDEIIKVKVLDDIGRRMAISMGHLSFKSQDIQLMGESREVVGEVLTIEEEQWRITAVSVGNPHCIIFSDDLTQIHQLGPCIESAPQFLQRTNVQVVRVLDEHSIQIAIWERGAGHTLASGTSATATAGAAIRHGFCRSPVSVKMEGGTAEVTIDETWQATLIGEVSAVYQGIVSSDLL